MSKGGATGGRRRMNSKKNMGFQQKVVLAKSIVAYPHSNIPYFKCWVRKEYTHNHEEYHGEFLHAMAVGVTSMPCRCLSFQVIFTGIAPDGEPEDTVHGGAMWPGCRLQA